ncbi:MAG: hypothetical protein AAGA91_20615 [Pseudomonadota bacterium]
MNSPIPKTAVEALIDAKDIALRHQLDVLLKERLTGLDQLQADIRSCKAQISSLNTVDDDDHLWRTQAQLDAEEAERQWKARLQTRIVIGFVGTWLATAFIGLMVFAVLR